MSRTIRHARSWNTIFRGPSGHRQACRDGRRHKSIPPNPREEILASPELRLPRKAAAQMAQAGLDAEMIITHLRKRWGLSHRDAQLLAKA